ncbi:hypothetical protein PB1_15889 [Bacillus methanolicus PB1]|uniref:Uncharacterized protein n=1 Tax=Bacillus methanolicus PB1 TaxID=997296 RepID=I3DXT3_BACMT|nr:hypothetical protein [Bacillus methanolicus]EIJ79054.1 hypothetical protein PB1_15889 [Bacillus methanolicus PB1]
MLKNERGNSLITVLLVSLVFTTLGLAIIASSIGGAKRVETRESDIHITYDAVKIIEKLTADLATSMGSISLDWEDDSFKPNISDYETQLRNLFNEKVQQYSGEEMVECLTIVDISNSTPTKYVDSSNSCLEQVDHNSIHYEIDTNNDITRAFEIVLVTKNPLEYEGKITRILRKRFILSPLSSFLKYAAGSYSEEKNKGLFLNGSANIYGNIYANQMAINENAKYQERDGDWSEQSTPMSSINGDIFSNTSNLFPLMKEENFYKGEVPDLKHDSQFVNIDFDKTMNVQTNKILEDSELSTERIGDGTGFSEQLKNEIKSKSQEESSSKDIKVDGDLVINSKKNPIFIDKKVWVNGDLYLLSYNDINLLENVYVSGKLHIINHDGKIEFQKNILCADSINIESNADNKNDRASKGLKVNGDIVTGNKLSVKAFNTAIEFNKNIIVNGSLTISGDESDNDHEDDEVIFDSVVYVGGKAFLSNVNILGAEENKKHLVLMTKKDLVITRMNEFNNFQDTAEGEKPYLPSADDKIKPLKAFFYTEEKAELYGVGSLFYINGGIFAKEQLEINAVRGKVTDINDLPSKSSQEDQLSRFIVEYNKNVLLEKIEALPIVEHLQFFSDELIIE